MSFSYYAEFSNHCLRFYSRYENPIFHTDVERKNWSACQEALLQLSDRDKQMIMDLFQSRDTLEDEIYKASKKYHVSQEKIWNLLFRTQRRVAEIRGII